MQAYYEIETDISKNHQLNLVLPDEIPEGKVKVAIIYEFLEPKNNAAEALNAFLNKYKNQNVDIDTEIFEENRHTVTDENIPVALLLS
jgi:hypothetical protein